MGSLTYGVSKAAGKLKLFIATSGKQPLTKEQLFNLPNSSPVDYIRMLFPIDISLIKHYVKLTLGKE